MPGRYTRRAASAVSKKSEKFSTVFLKNRKINWVATREHCFFFLDVAVVKETLKEYYKYVSHCSSVKV